MRLFLVCTLAAALFSLSGPGCSVGENLLVSPSGDAKDSSQVECFGDPDSGFVCLPLSELWDCTSLPNREVKCTRKGFQTPGGSGGWTCTVDGSRVTCTKPGSDVPNDANWACATDGQTTTCTYNSAALPPGGGRWVCTVSELDLSCVGDSSDGSTGSASGTSGSSGETGSGQESGGQTGTGEESGGQTGTGESGGSGWSGFGCSYAMFVFTYQGQTFIMKIDNGATTCKGDNTTSKDANFSYECNGQSCDNQDFVFNRDGVPCAEAEMIALQIRFSATGNANNRSGTPRKIVRHSPFVIPRSSFPVRHARRSRARVRRPRRRSNAARPHVAAGIHPLRDRGSECRCRRRWRRSPCPRWKWDRRLRV
jgi:hypothetical protein